MCSRNLLNLWACLVLCIAFPLYTANLIEVSYSGQLYVLEGKPFSIACLRSSYGAPKWSKDGQTLQERDGYKFHVDTLDDNLVLMKLDVDSAIWKHRGRYKCDALSEGYHKIEVVPLQETDEEMKRESRVRLRPGSVLELRCSQLENGIFPINWYKDGTRLLESEKDPRIILDGRTLKIRPVKEQDAGDYLCVVEVSGLSHPVADNLGRIFKVTYGARVQKFPPQIRPIVNRRLSVECKVHGFPTPRITWFVDDVPVEVFSTNDSRFEELDNAVGLPNAVFSISNASYEDNGHVVKCCASNMDGTSTTSAVLAVRANAINTNEEDPGKGIILTPGLELLLQCNVTEDRPSSVRWLKDSQVINQTDSRIHIINHNNTLSIDSATESDTGNYTCISLDGTSATIAVRTKVKLSPFDSSRNVVQGQNIVLVCNASQGMPLPSLHWYKNQELLNASNDRITITPKADARGESASVLTISDAEFDDRAEYMCIATNDVNSVNATILVRVKDKYAALWPFLGICAEVAVLCTVIFIYEKKRQKPDFDESDADHNTENKNVPDQDDKSREVRQRK